MCTLLVFSCFSDESGPMCLLVKPLINKGLKNQFANIIEVFKTTIRNEKSLVVYAFSQFFLFEGIDPIFCIDSDVFPKEIDISNVIVFHCD